MNSDLSSIASLLFILAFLVLAILLIAHKGKPRLNKNYFTKHWNEIEKMQPYTLAVLKADSLVDEAMKHAKVKGSTMGERLNNATGFLKDVNATWSAHKLRNNIAHQNGSDPTAMECQRALRQFKRALKDLGAL